MQITVGLLINSFHAMDIALAQWLCPFLAGGIVGAMQAAIPGLLTTTVTVAAALILMLFVPRQYFHSVWMPGHRHQH